MYQLRGMESTLVCIPRPKTIYSDRGNILKRPAPARAEFPHDTHDLRDTHVEVETLLKTPIKLACLFYSRILSYYGIPSDTS